jgi:hypothetical protein
VTYTEYIKHQPPDNTHSPPKHLYNIIQTIQIAAQMQAIAPTTSLSHEDSHPMNNTNLKDHNIIPPNDDKFTKQNITQVEPHKAIIRALKHNSIRTDIRPTSIRVQVDGGANRSITNNTALLTGYKNIKITNSQSNTYDPTSTDSLTTPNTSYTTTFRPSWTTHHVHPTLTCGRCTTSTQQYLLQMCSL